MHFLPLLDIQPHYGLEIPAVLKSTLKVEQWYSLLQDHLSVAGLGNRVVIIEDFHMANAIMANAMLKTIEEPPAQVYFIIITNKINLVLPTIISRCMGVGFQSVSKHIAKAFSSRSSFFSNCCKSLGVAFLITSLTGITKESFAICLEKIAKRKLPMKLINVEYTFDMNKIVFFFTADGRIDFRELVKDLATVFRTRIELRQVGVRDEAKVLNGIGACGRPL